MNKIWLQIFAAMIGGSIVKSFFPNSLVWVCVDIAVLGISYLILRRHSNINLKSSMIFLGGLTVVSILTDLGMMSDMMSSLFVLALLGWMMYGRRRNDNPKPPEIRHKWHK
ncbi:MAG: hypothetical protein H6Q68_2809 [Firmicutes bacterium]|nr:hypothetical protein [Bacillota bacterium]